jgi:hypothetical protein
VVSSELAPFSPLLIVCKISSLELLICSSILK